MKRPDLAKYNRLRRQSADYINPMKGRHHSEETKKKIVANRNNKAIGIKLKGRVYSPETIERMRQAKLGSKNPMYGIKRPAEKSGLWKGGITEENHGWRVSGKWQAVRKKVIIRDEFICQNCHKQHISLHVHHVVPYVENKELKLDMDNLITLCPDCHKEEHTCR